MAKTKTKRIISISLVVVALLSLAAIFYVYKFSRKTSNETTSGKNEGVENISEPTSASNWSSKSVEESGNQKVTKTPNSSYTYISKEYNFGFNFNKVAVTWNALASTNAKPIIYFSVFENGNWSNWSSHKLNLISRDTTYSSGDISATGSKIRFKIVFTSSQGKVEDFSLAVGGESVQEVYLKQIAAK